MHAELVRSIVASPNQAADDLLLEGLRVGNDLEQALVLHALLERHTVHGLSGVIAEYDALPERLQRTVLLNIKQLYHALRECGRNEDYSLRQKAMKLIALGRQCKLAYVLSENLHDSDESLSKTAAETVVALARWVAISTRRLQAHYQPRDESLPPTEKNISPDAIRTAADQESPVEDWHALYLELLDQRGEIESIVSRALDVHRGKHGADLLRAAMLLADHPNSKTLAILTTTRHAGQGPLLRRLQQQPEGETVDAFLMSSLLGHLRLHFARIMAHIEDPPALDALLRRTYWLVDHRLQQCVHLVNRGAWWNENGMSRDLNRLELVDVVKIADWLCASALDEVVLEERLNALHARLADNFPGRLHLLRALGQRPRESSVNVLKTFVNDPDERLSRMAVRELVRRKPADLENTLLKRMTDAPLSVRRIISRTIGQSGFENYWQRFDRLDRATRKQAGKAMLKLLPDAPQRLARLLGSGPIEQRIKALQVAQDLELGETLKDSIASLMAHAHAKVRSKAVMVLGDLPTPMLEALLESALNDSDARVRANAVEVLETRESLKFVKMLAHRAKNSQNRERANAIKALHNLRVGNVVPALTEMLRDQRPEHRISAMWAMKQIGMWRLLTDIGQIARADPNSKCRRYAVGILKLLAEEVRQRGRAA